LSSRVIEACYGELLRFARRRLGGAHAADDLVQEACLRFTRVDDGGIASPRSGSRSTPSTISMPPIPRPMRKRP
jgi:hypothetical protein